MKPKKKIHNFLIPENDSICLVSLYHKFLPFFSPMTGGKLKIILPTFPKIELLYMSCPCELFSSDFSVKFIPHQFRGF